MCQDTFTITPHNASVKHQIFTLFFDIFVQPRYNMIYVALKALIGGFFLPLDRAKLAV